MSTISKQKEIIEHLESKYASFNALAFCKKLKYEKLKDVKFDFKLAIKTISERSMKSKNVDKDLIKWARSIKKNNTDLFDSQRVLTHFYNLSRQRVLFKKRLLQVSDEESFMISLEAEDQNSGETSEFTDNEDEMSSSVTEDDNVESRIPTKNERTGTHAQHEESHTLIQSTESRTAIEEEDSEDMDDFKHSFKKQFERMNNEQKWYLCSGKCVEDELYALGMQCQEEHPCHSFIIDYSDLTYQNYQIFTPQELKEIKEFKMKPLPIMPVALRDYLNSFNKETAADLRSQLLVQQEFDKDYDHKVSHDFDWIRNTVYNLLREYEANKLKRPHAEGWFMSHVWNFVDTVFNDEDEIDVLRGESASGCSSKRKNSTRTIGGVMTMSTKKIGYKCDMVFSKARSFHGPYIEYGASEAGAKYEGNAGTKLMQEGLIKLPKCLKDMLDTLALETANYDELQTTGFLHSGLNSQFIRADRPVQYTTRITRCRSSFISNDISGFGASVLPAIYSAWVNKAVVKEVMSINQSSPEADGDSKWLEDLFSNDQYQVIVPETSTSTEIPRKKLRKSSR